MGRMKINRGPPRRPRRWKINGYYHSSKEMIAIIKELKLTCKNIYIRKINKPYIECPYIIYTQ